MAEIAAGWAFADAFVPEDEAIADARDAAHQFGIEPVSPPRVPRWRSPPRRTRPVR